jgi:hypothetical protein
MLHFFGDLIAIPAADGHAGAAAERIRQEAARMPFEEIRPAGNLLARIGSGKQVVMMAAQPGADGAAGVAGMVYAGKLIHELGMYDDFTLWMTSPVQSLKESGIRPDCVLVAEPTNLCIKVREAASDGFLSESHPLVQAAIDTYETLFELPPILSQSPSPFGPLGAPAIAFGAGEGATSPDGGGPLATRHLLKAAQFYASFPMMFVETLRQR